MFNSHLREQILKQERELARLNETVRLYELREKGLISQAEKLQSIVDEYEGADEEEIQLLAVLRKENLRAQIQSVQVDKQKEISEAFDVKPPRFTSDVV